MWGTFVGEYVTSLAAADRSPLTIRLHRHYLSVLAEHVHTPHMASTRELQALLARPGWSAETRKSCRSVLRGFFRWQVEAGYRADNPALGLAPVRVPPPVPRPAPETVVARIVRDRDSRIAFMAALAALAGLRAGEISRVHRADLLGDVLRVHGKGRRERVVPITHPALLERLERCDGWAFPGRIDGHLSPGHVSRLLSQALPDGWTAHTLRHRMATKAYAGTRDLLAVGALLGHSKPETTQRYIRLPDDALRAAMSAAAA